MVFRYIFIINYYKNKITKYKNYLKNENLIFLKAITNS